MSGHLSEAPLYVFTSFPGVNLRYVGLICAAKLSFGEQIRPSWDWYFWIGKIWWAFNEWYCQMFETLYEIITLQIQVEENMSDLVCSIVPADGLAPWYAGTFACVVMTVFVMIICNYNLKVYDSIFKYMLNQMTFKIEAFHIVKLILLC